MRQFFEYDESIEAQNFDTEHNFVVTGEDNDIVYSDTDMFHTIIAWRIFVKQFPNQMFMVWHRWEANKDAFYVVEEFRVFLDYFTLTDND